MVKEIIWSPLAIETYDEIIRYLHYEFGPATVTYIINLTENRLNWWFFGAGKTL